MKNSELVPNGGVNFFIIIFHFSIGKAAMNTLRLLKFCKDCLAGIGYGYVAAFSIKDVPHCSTSPMRPLLARSISLDSTFKQFSFGFQHANDSGQKGQLRPGKPGTIMRTILLVKIL
jgi:hypothetical protein